MMKEFKASYDKENDDLFIYLPKKKSKGAVEIGNFVLDFDENEKLVAIQIFEASRVLPKIISNIAEIIKVGVIKFRNMATIQLSIGNETTKIIIPRIKHEKSPASIKYS